jgi:pyruvate/2-oxoglutarate dehydrogenase complex dihydrolipoamide acyltransferase (E2) component
LPCFATRTHRLSDSWALRSGNPDSVSDIPGVKKGESVADVETDKAVMDVEAFHDGYLAGPLAAEGERTSFTLACEHRVLAGADAARFLQTFAEYLANLSRLSKTPQPGS